MSNLYIFPLSDLYLGSKYCNLDFFYEWCRKFEKTSDNKVIYLLGDMLEFNTARIDAYSSVMSTHGVSLNARIQPQQYKKIKLQSVFHECRCKKFLKTY